MKKEIKEKDLEKVTGGLRSVGDIDGATVNETIRLKRTASTSLDQPEINNDEIRFWPLDESR